MVSERVGQERLEQGGHRCHRDAVVDAGQVVGGGAAAMDDTHEAVAPLVVVGHHGHDAAARACDRVGQLRDVGHVGGPRQGPLDEQEGVERRGGSDRIDPLGLRPRRAAEGGVVAVGCVLDGGHARARLGRTPP